MFPIDAAPKPSSLSSSCVPPTRRRFISEGTSIEMEDLGGWRPPLPGGGRADRLLAGAGEQPPALGGLVRCDARHVGLVIVAGVLEIAEQMAVTEEDRVVR